MHSRQPTPRRRLAVLATAVAALTLVGATTVDANRGRPDKEVPIHGTFVGVDEAIEAPEGDRCYDLGYPLHYTSKGVARVAHLGRVEMIVDHCTDVVVPPGAPGPIGGSFGYGAMVMTAANGDVLVLEHSGTFVFEGPYSYVDQQWEIVDMFTFGDEEVYSTGRFAGASGAGTGDLIGNLMESSIEGSMSGVIVYDASNRANR